MRVLKTWVRDERGQDLIEYTIVLALGAIASLALFLGLSQNAGGLWKTTNSTVANANTYASGSGH
jgi:Flp pilus assembly pilin Flp